MWQIQGFKEVGDKGRNHTILRLLPPSPTLTASPTRTKSKLSESGSVYVAFYLTYSSKGSRIVQGTHRPRMHRPREASSKGRIVSIVQGTHRPRMHRPREASSKGRIVSIVQGMHRLREALCKGRNIRDFSFCDTLVGDEIARHPSVSAPLADVVRFNTHGYEHQFYKKC